MNHEAFYIVLARALPREQLQAVLQKIGEGIDEGYCPICYGEEKPLGEQPITMVLAAAWRQYHYGECPVTRLQALLEEAL